MKRHLTVLLSCAALGGCGTPSWPEPWVKPYEREHLTGPLMQLSRDTLAERHRAHVQEVREGSRRDTTAQGGGCGCN